MRSPDKPYIKIAKISAALFGSGLFIAYHVYKTYININRIINHNVLETEKKHTAEYIYIDDPTYDINIRQEQDRDYKQSVGLGRIWKSLKHSLAWRLLWLCRHGNAEQRNVALVQLAAFKNNKEWDCLKLAQAMDINTAVLLARTQGADLRYFLPPPIFVRRAASTQQLLSYHFKDMIAAIEKTNPHSCIQHFLSKYFANVQELDMEADSVPTKPDTIRERDLCIQCLGALHHHISLFCKKTYEDDTSSKILIEMGLLPKLAELILRNPNDVDLNLAVLEVLTVLSVYPNLCTDFYQFGLLKELSRLIRSNDVRLSSSAAVCLANLSGEYCYRPGLYLLHPIYRTTTPHKCDTLLVHGLRGGVFVTWRQRDRKCVDNTVDTRVLSDKCDTCQENKVDNKYVDPELQQVIDDIMELEDEALLSDYEVILYDLPISTKRASLEGQSYAANRKRMSLIQEEQDKCSYTYCWPKDWLPKDCNNLRILGVNYWTSLSNWLERCPLQTADIEVKAAELIPSLIDAEVGKKNVPVVWLAHSMGGLIVKQVLIEASQNIDQIIQKLCDNTRAIFFFSTPHKGSAFAKMPRAAAAVLWPTNDVRQLEENSPVLLEIQKIFIKLADRYNWETISFAETEPTLVTAFKVPIQFVEPVSADLGRGIFYELPLDHMSICKPATRQSILYTSVLDILNKITSKSIGFKNMSLVRRWFGNKNPKDVIEVVDDSPKNSNLCWLDQVLLELFTDGFTD